MRYTVCENNQANESLAIINEDSVDCCVRALNGFNDNLFFTYEKEVNNNISFLDIKIIRVEEQLKTDLMWKTQNQVEC